jgi:hypothetical protein
MTNSVAGTLLSCADCQSQGNNLGQYGNNDRTRELCPRTIPEHDDGLIEQQCDHFSIR